VVFQTSGHDFECDDIVQLGTTYLFKIAKYT